MADERKAKSDPVPLLEWAAAAFGLVMALALLAVLGWAIVHSGDDRVPVLEAHLEAVTATPGGQVAQIRVTNRSGQTAAAVQIEGKLGGEVASATIDYIPAHSEASAGLIFERDPRAGLELSVLGYELP